MSHPSVTVRHLGLPRLSQTSYPVCDKIPLRLVMTCVNRVALDLFAVSDVIKIRLLRVLAFGKKAATARPPFTLRNRKAYHITKWVANAHWYADGEDKELPPDDEHPGSRWRTKLNGELRREPYAELSHSFAEPGMAVMVRGFMVLQRTSHKLTDVIHSTTCACFHSVHRISAQQATQTKCFFMARFYFPNSGQINFVVETRASHSCTGAPPRSPLLLSIELGAVKTCQVVTTLLSLDWNAHQNLSHPQPIPSRHHIMEKTHGTNNVNLM